MTNRKSLEDFYSTPDHVLNSQRFIGQLAVIQEATPDVCLAHVELIQEHLDMADLLIASEVLYPYERQAIVREAYEIDVLGVNAAFIWVKIIGDCKSTLLTMDLIHNQAKTSQGFLHGGQKVIYEQFATPLPIELNVSINEEGKLTGSIDAIFVFLSFAQ